MGPRALGQGRVRWSRVRRGLEADLGATACDAREPRGVLGAVAARPTAEGMTRRAATARRPRVPRVAPLLRVRPNAFAAPLGLIGLAGVWRAMAELYGWTGRVADALCVIAALVSVVLGALALARLVRLPRLTLTEDLTDPVQSPFCVLPFIVVTLLGATGLAPHDRAAADILTSPGQVQEPA